MEGKQISVHLMDLAKGRVVQTWRFEGKEVVRIGRSEQNDVVIGDPYASRFHTELQYREPRWHLVNQGRHGTVMNGEKVNDVPLEDGAVFRLGGRPSIRLARYFPWIEMRAGDLLVRQRQGAGWRSGGASANTVQRRFSAPLGSFDELFGRPVLVAIHGQGCASSKCCASGKSRPIRRAPSPARGRETRASRAPV